MSCRWCDIIFLGGEVYEMNLLLRSRGAGMLFLMGA